LFVTQAIAVEAGFDVTVEDWTKYIEENPLSDEDLEDLTGGIQERCTTNLCSSSDKKQGLI